MLVRRLQDIENTPADVKADTWRSRRLLLKGDGMGFSVHDTIIHAGTITRMWYRHHLEAVYCIEGTGTLEALDSGELWSIEPGTLYALDRHDKHMLRAETTLRLVCVFQPGVVGTEVHGPDGSYPAAAE